MTDPETFEARLDLHADAFSPEGGVYVYEMGDIEIVLFDGVDEIDVRYDGRGSAKFTASVRDASFQGPNLTFTDVEGHFGPEGMTRSHYNKMEVTINLNTGDVKATQKIL